MSPKSEEKIKRRLIRQSCEEIALAQEGEYVLPIHLDLLTLASVVGALQLALRHPANNGSSSQTVRAVIDQIIQRVEADGYEATADVMRLGDNPEFDELAGGGE